jgi:hypothetical protein
MCSIILWTYNTGFLGNLESFLLPSSCRDIHPTSPPIQVFWLVLPLIWNSSDGIDKNASAEVSAVCSVTEVICEWQSRNPTSKMGVFGLQKFLQNCSSNITNHSSGVPGGRPLSFDKAKPNSQFRGIYIRNNLIRKSEYSFHSFANGGEPLTKGLPPPDIRSLCPLSSTKFVETLPPLQKKILCVNPP